MVNPCAIRDTCARPAQIGVPGLASLYPPNLDQSKNIPVQNDR
jgi:hypothetical protein